VSRISPVALVVGAVIAAVGVLGLVRGAVPSAPAGAPATAATASPPIVVAGAYVREPASPDVAAAYFTVYNTTDQPDTLISVSTGAGEQATLHLDKGGSMTTASGGITVPAHGSVTLKAGTGHVMIEKLFGPLRAGQTVNIELTFAINGTVLVTAPVIGVLAPTPSVTAPAGGPS
jgi:copper(I)-binding protein